MGANVSKEPSGMDGAMLWPWTLTRTQWPACRSSSTLSVEVIDGRPVSGCTSGIALPMPPSYQLRAVMEHAICLGMPGAGP